MRAGVAAEGCKLPVSALRNLHQLIIFFLNKTCIKKINVTKFILNKNINNCNCINVFHAKTTLDDPMFIMVTQSSLCVEKEHLTAELHPIIQ